MKTRVKTGKLAVLLLTLMTLVCLPIIAFAQEGGSTIKVTMTVNNKGVIAVAADGSAMIEKEVVVADLNEDGKFSYDEALVAAHKAYCKDGESGYVTTTSQYGLQVTKLWGTDSTNNLFFANGAGLSENVGDTAVVAGDDLYASINADDTNYCDIKTSFDAKELKGKVGEKVNVTLTGFIGIEGGDPIALQGIKIGYWKDGAFVELPGVVTDAKGAASFTPAETGTFILTANGSTPVKSQWYGDVTAPVMAPYAFLTVDKGSVSKADVTIASATYNGKAQTPAPTVKVGDLTLKKDVDFTAAYSNNVNAGTANVTITGKGNFADTIAKTFTINKASQTVKVKAKTFKIKKSKVAKKKQTIDAKKVTKSNSAKTKISYSLSKANKSKKKFKVASSGKITVSKGLKKGTYKLTIKAAAAADKNYKAASKTFKVTINVK